LYTDSHDTESQQFADEPDLLAQAARMDEQVSSSLAGFTDSTERCAVVDSQRII